jgi:polysaccharide biosynthesis protein PslH
MSDKTTLLFISPIVPSNKGNGLAMRAGAWLKALSVNHKITLLVIPISDNRRDLENFELSEFCESAQLISIPFWASVRSFRFLKKCFDYIFKKRFDYRFLGKVQQFCKSFKYDHVFIFRLYMLPYAEQFLPDQLEVMHLDLDDIESQTHRDLASLYQKNREPNQASKYKSKASYYEKLEAESLTKFKTVYVCSDADRKILSQKYQLRNVEIASNSVLLPDRQEKAAESEPFTFLFLGNLNYYPNQDAVRFFISEILPKIKQRAKKSFRLQIVGSGQRKTFESLMSEPEVQFIGYVPEVESWYRKADAFVAPLRAGGGTRIKILEAFSYGLPVVSTGAGITGIEAEAGRDFLLADSAEEFASSCLRLLDDRKLREELGNEAYNLVASRYCSHVFAQTLRPFQEYRK